MKGELWYVYWFADKAINRTWYFESRGGALRHIRDKGLEGLGLGVPVKVTETWRRPSKKHPKWRSWR